MSAPSARAVIDIDAPVERVWQVLSTLSAYPEWNPFVVKVDGAAKAELGKQLVLHVVWSNGRRVSTGELVTRVEPNAALAWRFTGVLPSLNLVRAERLQTLTALGAGATRYESVESFSGLLARFVPLAGVVEGFGRMARALKVRAEAPR